MRRAYIMGLGGAAVAIAGTVALAWLPLGPPPPAASPAMPTATAEITRGTLLDTRTVTGTLSYGELTELRPAVSGDSAMVTWMAPVGATVHRGEPLYRLDGRPTILFYGTVPQHRTLRFEAGDASPVWVELEQAGTAVDAATLELNLARQRVADADARITDATSRLDDALASRPTTAEFAQLDAAVNTAAAKVDRVRELASAELTPTVNVAAAEAELATARAALDRAVRAVRRDLANARLDALTARTAVATAQTKLDDLRAARDTLAAQAGDDADVRQIADNLAVLGYGGTLVDQVLAWQRDTGLPLTGIIGRDSLVVATGPVHIADHKASTGETLFASSADRGSLLDYSSIEKLVTVPLSVGDRGLAAIGRGASITLPDDTRVEGTISQIGSVVTEDKVEVTITIADQAALGALEVASVDVELVSERREDVLSVPVAALLARPEGGFAVEIVGDGRGHVVPVDTGLFGSGRVEVKGDGIAEGVHVGVPR